jgi:RNA polymerase sigma-70 factor (ECF subfamily)
LFENEKYLLEKSKEGDIEAFEYLVTKYQKKVFNIALRLLGNYDDASELTQEAFIKIYKSIKNFKEESLLSTWIYRIATNVCLDELRKRKKRWVLSLDEEIQSEDGGIHRQVEDDSPTPDVIAEINDTKNTINKAIRKLQEEHRIVLILRDLQGFSYEEIAKIINRPEGTVKSRINRARSELRELLLKNGELFNGDFVKKNERRVGNEKV